MPEPPKIKTIEPTMCCECNMYEAEESYNYLCVYCYSEYLGHSVVTCYNCSCKSLDEEDYFLFENHMYCRGCYELEIEENSDSEYECEYECND
jgi:hypothetical protein